MGGNSSKETEYEPNQYRLTTDNSKFSGLFKQHNLPSTPNTLKELFDVKLDNNEILVQTVEKLFNSITNRVKITSETFSNSLLWISKPTTLGDLCAIRLMNIFIWATIEVNSTKEEIIRKEIVIESVLRENMIDYFSDLLKVYYIKDIKDLPHKISPTQIDIAILFFYVFVNEDRLILNNSNVDLSNILSRLCKILTYSPKIEVRNRHDHIIACVYVIRKILSVSTEIKKLFLEKGGYKILYSNIQFGNSDLIKESLSCLEVLLFVRKHYFLNLYYLII